MQTFDFLPFEPTFRAFELAIQGEHAHKHFANSPEQPIRFMVKEALPTGQIKFDAEPLGHLIPAYSCHYETFTFPEQQMTISMLHITGPDTDFYYVPTLSTFLTRKPASSAK